MEQNSLNKNSVVSFIFNKETRNWKIINGGGGVTGKISTSEETGRERLLAYCLRFPFLNLVKNEQRILLKYNNHIVGKVEYRNKESLSLIQFLYDILSAIQKGRKDLQIVPSFHLQEEGIKMTILKNAIVLNNVFGKNNLLSEEEQEFFLKSFQNLNDYDNLLHSSFGRILRNTMQIEKVINKCAIKIEV